jgi:hypothetical protein
MIRKFLPFLMLLYGLYSLFTLQRDFEHIGRLVFCLMMIAPASLLLAFGPALLDRIQPDSRLHRYRQVITWLNTTAALNLTQYILMFCLPFFAVKEAWFYFSLHILILGITMWDPICSRLMKWASFRHSLQAWTLMSAFSFLFPFILPGFVKYFYPCLAGILVLAFIPTQREKKYLRSQALLLLGLIALLLLPPLPMRFPLLSVWLKKPHFALDRKNAHEFGEHLPKLLMWSDLRSEMASEASLCCIAPVVAPPAFREKLTQEWILDDKVLETAHLKTTIQGRKSTDSAFRSFYCKKNFPPIETDATLRCLVYLQEAVYLGGVRQALVP